MLFSANQLFKEYAMHLRSAITLLLLVLSVSPAGAAELLHPLERDFETELLPGRWQPFTWGNTRDSGAFPALISGGFEHVSGNPLSAGLEIGSPTGWGERSLTLYHNEPIEAAARSHVGGVRITVPTVPGQTYTFSAWLRCDQDESPWQYGAGMTVDAKGGIDPREATHGIKGNGRLLAPSANWTPGDMVWNQEPSYNNEHIWITPDQFRITATAQSDRMTLYLWALAKYINDTRVQFDGVSIQGTDSGDPIPTPVPQTMPVTAYRAGTADVGLYEPWTVGITFDCEFENPYDPREIAVDFEFTGPSGETRTIPAFYTATKPEFQARIVPLETGLHTARIYAVDAEGRRGELNLTFNALPSDARGFVRQDSRNRYRLRFDNGDPYNFVGHNTCWVVGQDPHINYLREMAEAGENWTRFWMSALVGTGIEWGVNVAEEHDDLGTYDPIQARNYERGLDFCRDNGIYAQVCTDSFNEWHDNPAFYPFWGPSPYNAANGGPLTHPIQYLTNDEAKRLAKQRYRYIVARWAAHTSVLCWELFNEVDAMGSGTAQTYHNNRTTGRNWHREMAQYIQSIDPFDHPITTSFAYNSNQWSEIWNLDEIGIVELHGYVGRVPNDQVNDIRTARQYNKPIIYGEGNINGLPDGKPSKDLRFASLFPKEKAGINKWGDLQGQSLHDQVWGTVVYENCAMSWWWDGWIHPNNLYRRIRPAADFVEGEDWAPYQLAPVQSTVTSGQSGVEVFGSASANGGMLWIRYQSGTLNNLRLRLPQITASELDVEFWDTGTGQVLASGSTSGGNNWELNVPPFTRDIAVKIKGNEPATPRVNLHVR